MRFSVTVRETGDCAAVGAAVFQDRGTSTAKITVASVPPLTTAAHLMPRPRQANFEGQMCPFAPQFVPKLPYLYKPLFPLFSSDRNRSENRAAALTSFFFHFQREREAFKLPWRFSSMGSSPPPLSTHHPPHLE